jgi:hypothetical protein
MLEISFTGDVSGDGRGERTIFLKTFRGLDFWQDLFEIAE